MSRYIIFLLLMTATSHDKQAIKNKFHAAFKDTAYVDVTTLGKECLISNTNKVYWRLVVDKRQLTTMGVDLSNITVAKFNIWKNANLDNPNQLQVAVCDPGQGWEEVLNSNGFKRVPQHESPVDP